MKTPVRILVAHQVPPARTGGMSRIMGFLHDEADAAEGWETDFFCADRLPAGVREPLSRLVFPRLVLRHARRAAHAGRPYAILNVHEPHAGLVVALRRLLGKTAPRVVVTSHGLEARTWELDKEEARRGRRPLSWRSRLARGPTILWPSAAALRGADHVFCLNREDADCLVARFGRRREDVTRLFPGVGAVFADAAAGRDYVLPSAGPRLLFAGTWRHNKGILDLVPAFRAILSRHPAARLSVLGAGVPAETVRGAFPEETRERVDVRQTTDDAGAARVFAEQDVFLLPSLFEGTPLTLIEAMASGLPIVSTATCGMRDVIRDGANGRLVPTRDPAALARATGELLDDADIRARLGRAARADAQTVYTWPRAAEPLRAAYRRLLAQTP